MIGALIRSLKRTAMDKALNNQAAIIDIIVDIFTDYCIKTLSIAVGFNRRTASIEH
jgi:hypothetical protein